MKKLYLVAVLAGSTLLMGFQVGIPVVGSYNNTQTNVKIQMTVGTAYPTMVAAAQTAIVGNLSYGSFPAHWYALGIFGWNESKQDASREPVTINGLTPVATSSTGAGNVTLAPRKYPNYKAHPARSKSWLVFEVLNTATPTATYTKTATRTSTPTYTSTNTPTVTNTYTSTATYTNTTVYTATPTYTGSWIATATAALWTSTPTYTRTFTYTATPTYTNTVLTSTPTYTPTATFSFTPTYTATGSATPTFTITNTPTGTLSPSLTPTNTPTVTSTCTCAASWTPGCWNH